MAELIPSYPAHSPVKNANGLGLGFATGVELPVQEATECPNSGSRRGFGRAACVAAAGLTLGAGGAFFAASAVAAGDVQVKEPATFTIPPAELSVGEDTKSLDAKPPIIWQPNGFLGRHEGYHTVTVKARSNHQLHGALGRYYLSTCRRTRPPELYKALVDELNPHFDVIPSPKEDPYSFIATPMLDALDFRISLAVPTCVELSLEPVTIVWVNVDNDIASELQRNQKLTKCTKNFKWLALRTALYPNNESLFDEVQAKGRPSLFGFWVRLDDDGLSFGFGDEARVVTPYCGRVNPNNPSNDFLKRWFLPTK